METATPGPALLSLLWALVTFGTAVWGIAWLCRLAVRVWRWIRPPAE